MNFQKLSMDQVFEISLKFQNESLPLISSSFLFFFIVPQSIYSSGLLSCIIHLLLIIPDMSFRNSYRQHQYLFLSFRKILIKFNYIRWYWKVPRQDYIHVKDLMDCSVTVFVNSFTNFPHYLPFFTSDPS